MLYNLLSPLAENFIFFNLFRYLTFRTGGAIMTALIICFVIGPGMIRWLKSKQAEGQPIRVDGPETHFKKAGTPTMGGLMVLISVAASTLLWADLADTPPFGKNTNTIFWLLNIDLIILLVLVSLVAQRIAGLWSGRRRGQAGSKLHVRLVFIFSLLALTPAIIMTIFSALFFHYGVQSWFSDKIHNAISQSEAFAEAYMAEHQQVIKADMLAMANDLNRSANSLADNPLEFEIFPA